MHVSRLNMIHLRPMLADFRHWHPRLNRWVNPGERLPGLWLATMDGRTCIRARVGCPPPSPHRSPAHETHAGAVGKRQRVRLL